MAGGTLREMSGRLGIISIILLMLVMPGVTIASDGQTYQCTPTAEDELGPLYEAGAPLRNSVGKGYLLFGTVKSATDCREIPAARIEIWLAGPEGVYGDDWRATLFSNENGAYFFESHTPPLYGRRPAHIHIKVTADNYQELITQHYPVKDSGEASLDLVLIPSN